MAEQPELDLPPVPSSAPKSHMETRKLGFGGFSRSQLIAGLLLIGVAVWGMWVTRLLMQPKQEHIVSARLSSLVGDYVEAQRFSGSPPERVRAEMQAFMSSLDKELQRRSENGQIVLVGEAVLTKNVPDITETLKKAVFASGIPEPKRMSVEELQRMQELSAAQTAVAAAQQPPLVAPGTIDPMVGVPFAVPQGPEGRAIPSQLNPSLTPGASVSTFGGADVNGGQ